MEEEELRRLLSCRDEPLHHPLSPQPHLLSSPYKRICFTLLDVYPAQLAVELGICGRRATFAAEARRPFAPLLSLLPYLSSSSILPFSLRCPVHGRFSLEPPSRRVGSGDCLCSLCLRCIGRVDGGRRRCFAVLSALSLLCLVPSTLISRVVGWSSGLLLLLLRR